MWLSALPDRKLAFNLKNEVLEKAKGNIESGWCNFSNKKLKISLFKNIVLKVRFGIYKRLR